MQDELRLWRCGRLRCRKSGERRHSRIRCAGRVSRSSAVSRTGVSGAFGDDSLPTSRRIRANGVQVGRNSLGFQLRCCSRSGDLRRLGIWPPIRGKSPTDRGQACCSGFPPRRRNASTALFILSAEKCAQAFDGKRRVVGGMEFRTGQTDFRGTHHGFGFRSVTPLAARFA